ncbi:MAG: hypothetical protein H6Q89_2172 [Myxococcaceae bacterium]|nr:hypothetical protein [Myxococcaceae bacterium]
MSKPRVFSRREALQLAATSAAGLVTVGGGLWLAARHHANRDVVLPSIRSHRVEQPAGAPRWVVARGPDAAANVRRALEAIGGMGAFVKRGESVLIKPNVGWNRLPEQAANTNPEVVAEVVRHVRAAGAAKIWVADVPVNAAERCFERSGISRAVGDAGATVLLPGSNSFTEVSVGGQVLQSANVLKVLADADKVINLPMVKQHGLTQLTGCLKNWYGVLGGHRVRLHQDIHHSIVDLAAMAKPTLTVLDATRVLMANGPTGGSLSDVKRLDTIVVGLDEVALDTFGASLMGFDPAEIGFLEIAEKAGLGTRDFRSLKSVEIPG